MPCFYHGPAHALLNDFFAWRSIQGAECELRCGLRLHHAVLQVHGTVGDFAVELCGLDGYEYELCVFVHVKHLRDLEPWVDVQLTVLFYHCVSHGTLLFAFLHPFYFLSGHRLSRFDRQRMHALSFAIDKCIVHGRDSRSTDHGNRLIVLACQGEGGCLDKEC